MKKISLFLVFAALAMIMVVSVSAASTRIAARVIVISMLNHDPYPANAGQLVDVRLGIENRGGETFPEFVMELAPKYPFSLVPGEDAVRKIGTMGAYQDDESMKIVKYKILVDKDAASGSYDLDFYYYGETDTLRTGKKVQIEVGNKESAEVIYIDQVELVPGKITPMTFTINNVGLAPLKELSFNWENENDIILPVGSDNTKYIKYIDVGGHHDLTFNVVASANADPDLYKLDLMLTYADPATGVQRTFQTKAGVYVGGATDFDVAFSGMSSGEASFSISNIGSVSASSVTVKVPEQDGWRIRGSDSVIIGNLNKGDYTIASFTLSQVNVRAQQTDSTENAGADQRAIPRPETSKVKLDITYTDARGNRNTVRKEVSIDQSSLIGTAIAGTTTAVAGMQNRAARQNPRTSWFSGTTRWVLIGAVALVLLILFKKKYKRERLKDPNYTVSNLLKHPFRSGKR